METTVQSLLDKKGRKVFTVRPDQTVYEAVAEMEARNVGGLLVMDGDQVVGIITERDYLRKMTLHNRSDKETPVETIMTRDLVSVTPDCGINEAMTLMTEKRCRHLPVLKDGRLDGILSIGDLVKAMIAGQQFRIQLLEDYVNSR